jgi:hypothetical protein
VFRLQTVLPELGPLLSALALASLIVLISTSFRKMNKVFFQATLFGATVAAGLSYLVAHKDPMLDTAWAAFTALSTETRFCLSLVLTGAVYFGGAMYIAAPDEPAAAVKPLRFSPKNAREIFRTPASVDTAVTFEVPESLPADDKVFFEWMLDK